MSEHHTETTPQTNGSTRGRGKKSEVATSTVNGTVITFQVVNGETVSVDVSKFPDASKLEQALVGTRNSLRLSFQKMEDPAKVVATLRQRVAKLLAGESTIGTRRRESKEPDELTLALATLTGKTPQFIENKWYNNYFASKESGCTSNTVNGKTRVYGKKEALAALRSDPNVKAEIDKIVKARSSGKPATVAKKIDLASIAAD